MRPAPLPGYLAEAARWFSEEVANPHIGIRAAARRPFREIQEVEGPLLVRSGLIAITTVDASGVRRTVGLRYPGELILRFSTAANVMLEAVLDSDLDAADGSAFDDALSARPEMHAVLSHIMSREKAIAYEWLAQFGLRGSLGRLAHLLCETFFRMSVDFAQPLKLPFNQQQLGEITGQTTVNVNRMLAQLEQRNLMSRDGRSVFVKDWPGLTHLAGFDPAYLT